MPNDVLELPNDVIIIIFRQMVHDLIVRQDIFIGIIIDATPELDIGGGILSVIEMLIDNFNDAELGCLTILLCDSNCPPISSSGCMMGILGSIPSSSSVSASMYNWMCWIVP